MEYYISYVCVPDLKTSSLTSQIWEEAVNVWVVLNDK